MTAQDTIPEDIMQAANAAIASAQSLITIDTIEQAMDGHMAIRDVYAAEIAKAILAERQRCEGDFGQVGWVHSIPNPRFGIETFFSVGKPHGNVPWVKAYARLSDFTTEGGEA